MTGGKVAVALSGGLDSSVAALFLKSVGYEVMGIHMQLWDSPRSEQQAHQAEAICHILKIPYYLVDLRQEFKLRVVDYFCREYQEGRTPNPCVTCNRYIKFGLLLDKALSFSADYLATGHYANLEYAEDSYRLYKAADAGKDQSYFLYTLSQEKLNHIIFPLGEYTKVEVQQIAKQAGLPTTNKPSQDICFISRKNYRTFLQKRFPAKAGEIVDTKGTILGHHQGIATCTIGQRHGLGLAFNEPLYVIRIEPEYNRVVLGAEKELYSQELHTEKLNWISGKAPCQPITVMARIRYKSKDASAMLYPGDNCADVCFTRPQKAVTPGQAIVFYQGNEVLGGSTIAN